MDESHNLLLDMHERFLADANGHPSGDFAARWGAAAELGLLLALAADEAGGIGSDGDFRFAFFHQRGEHLALPEFGPAISGVWTILTGAGSDALAEAFGTGQLIAALPTILHDFDPFSDSCSITATRDDDVLEATGEITIVRGAPHSTHFLVPAVHKGEPAILLIARNQSGVVVEPFRLLDEAESGKVLFDSALASLIASGSLAKKLWHAAISEMIAAAAAEAVGIGRAMLAQTVAYIRQRKQFGQTIGSFQAVQHRMAEMLVEVEQAHALALAACRTPHDCFTVSAAKLRACTMLQMVADNSVQFHGGIGTTQELVLSRYFRRAIVIRGELGTANLHLARIEDILAAQLMADEGRGS